MAAAAVRKSTKRKLLAFSSIFFLVILVAGSVAYVVSMRNIIHSGKAGELRQVLEVERIKLEASVNSQIAILLKMANSPLIQQYFANPADPELEVMAFEEIAEYRRALTGNSVFWVNDIDKKFYFDSAYAFTVNPAEAKNYWYALSLRETERYNININYNPDIEKTNIWINAPVFDKKGKPIGILGTSIDLTTFVGTIYKNYSGNADLYFFNNAGEITGARDASLAAKKVLIDKQLEKTGERIFKYTENPSAGHIDSFITKDGVVAVGTVPVFDWYIAVIQPLDMKDYVKTEMVMVFLIVVLAIMFVIVVFNALA